MTPMGLSTEKISGKTIVVTGIDPLLRCQRPGMHGRRAGIRIVCKLSLQPSRRPAIADGRFFCAGLPVRAGSSQSCTVDS
jgi:hypothetical protein